MLYTFQYPLAVELYCNSSLRTSFFLYLMPSDRHDTALVTAIGGRAWTSILYASVLMNSDRIFASVNCAGRPQTMSWQLHWECARSHTCGIQP